MHDDVDRRRTVEIAVRATPDCRDLDTTVGWAESRLASEGLDHLFEFEVWGGAGRGGEDLDEPCHTPRIDWQSGLVRVTAWEAAESGPSTPVD